jgi:NhaA family Na+:H+ antiporter
MPRLRAALFSWLSRFLPFVAANSVLAGEYFHRLYIYIGPLSLQHWINDALIAVFFLLAGLEIKREMLDG